jgi:hypothetical protein
VSRSYGIVGTSSRWDRVPGRAAVSATHAKTRQLILFNIFEIFGDLSSADEKRAPAP